MLKQSDEMNQSNKTAVFIQPSSMAENGANDDSSASKLDLKNYLNQQYSTRKVTNIPMEFQCKMADILSKEFTKLKNPYRQRIHYLGYRFTNTINLHKKCAFSEKSPWMFSNTTAQNSQASLKKIEKYKVDSRSIVQTFSIEDKHKNTTFFKSTVFYRAFEGMNPSLKLDNEFIFDSLFEGGNLDCVIKKLDSENEFDLFLRIDSNTRGHILWFYFSVKNQKNLGKIKMNIYNFSKSKNLYREGLKPYILSTRKNELYGKGWEQSGENLGVEKKKLNYQALEGKCDTDGVNCLSLEYDFQHTNDQVFFSYCIPYTYSQLLNDIENLPKRHIVRGNLGKSLMGVNIPILHITEHNFNNQQQQQQPNTAEKKQKKLENNNINEYATNFCNATTTANSELEERQIIKKSQLNPTTVTHKPQGTASSSYFVSNNKRKNNSKKIILITGRIHPSQSNSSYVLMGFIQWLVSEQAKEIRKLIDFIIIPMVNPDGVIIGNSRTSASGKDLNREYIDPDPNLFPEVFMIKQLAKKLHRQNRQIQLFLDFHGHSRKKNTFFYGPVYAISQPNYYKCRILPKLIQKISNPFRYHSCSFSIIQDKKKTARASMFAELGIDFTYTVQSSIGYFYDSEKMKILEYSEREWRSMGLSIAKGTSQFVTGLLAYQQILRERRQQRLRKKNNSKIMKYETVFLKTSNQHYLQDDIIQNECDENNVVDPKENNKKLESKHKHKLPHSNIFLNMMEELRKNAKSPPSASANERNQPFYRKDSSASTSRLISQIDKQEDSDSHDQDEDLDQNRLNEFKGLVIIQNNCYKQTSFTQIAEGSDRSCSRSSSKKLNFYKKKPAKAKSQLNKNNVFDDQFELLQEFAATATKDDNIDDASSSSQIRLTSANQGNLTVTEQTAEEEIQKGQQIPQIVEQTLAPTLTNSKLHYLHDEKQQKTFINRASSKRAVYTSNSKRGEYLNSGNLGMEKKEHIKNHFGQYVLPISESDLRRQQQIKKQKIELIRRFQSRRQRSSSHKRQSLNRKQNLQTGGNPRLTFYSTLKGTNSSTFRAQSTSAIASQSCSPYKQRCSNRKDPQRFTRSSNHQVLDKWPSSSLQVSRDATGVQSNFIGKSQHTSPSKPYPAPKQFVFQLQPQPQSQNYLNQPQPSQSQLRSQFKKITASNTATKLFAQLKPKLKVLMMNGNEGKSRTASPLVSTVGQFNSSNASGIGGNHYQHACQENQVDSPTTSPYIRSSNNSKRTVSSQYVSSQRLMMMKTMTMLQSSVSATSTSMQEPSIVDNKKIEKDSNNIYDDDGNTNVKYSCSNKYYSTKINNSNQNYNHSPIINYNRNSTHYNRFTIRSKSHSKVASAALSEFQNNDKSYQYQQHQLQTQPKQEQSHLHNKYSSKSFIAKATSNNTYEPFVADDAVSSGCNDNKNQNNNKNKTSTAAMTTAKVIDLNSKQNLMGKEQKDDNNESSFRKSYYVARNNNLPKQRNSYNSSSTSSKRFSTSKTHINHNYTARATIISSIKNITSNIGTNSNHNKKYFLMNKK